MKTRNKVLRDNTFFGFQARNEETDELRFLGFTVTIPSEYEGDVDRFVNDLLDRADYTEFFENQEGEYGVHDGFFGAWSIVYDSYEVAFDRLDDLMAGWRAYFVGGLGGDAVGPVVELPIEVWEAHFNNEEEVFNALNESK